MKRTSEPMPIDKEAGEEELAQVVGGRGVLEIPVYSPPGGGVCEPVSDDAPTRPIANPWRRRAPPPLPGGGA